MSDKEKKLVNNSLTYILFFLLVTILFLAIYFYSNFKFIEKNEFKNKYIMTEDIEFYDLPYSIKYKYQKKEDCKKSSFKNIDNNKLKDEINSLKKLNDNLYQKLDNISAFEDKIILLNKKITDLKNINKKLLLINKQKTEAISKNNITKKITNKYTTMMCTDMQKSKYNMTKECFNNIQKFVVDNKNAKYFEVMGMISKEDFSKEDFKNDIIKTGFATKRARVVIWVLREALEFKSKVLPVNYYITSHKNYKGTVIRAYY
jgi:hypothetical protein